MVLLVVLLLNVKRSLRMVKLSQLFKSMQFARVTLRSVRRFPLQP